MTDFIEAYRKCQELQEKWGHLIIPKGYDIPPLDTLGRGTLLMSEEERKKWNDYIEYERTHQSIHSKNYLLNNK